MRFENVDRALAEPDTALRLFGKPEVRGHRRMGVSLALGATIEEARAKARKMTQMLLEGREVRVTWLGVTELPHTQAHRQ